MTTKDLGMVTAYAYAVMGGYEGTEAEFEALLGNIATDLEEIENLTVIANTLPEGSSATASYADGVLTLGIPKGDTGATGAGATATVGTTTTGDPGTNASVTNSGTAKDAVFNFTIPRGATGNGIESIYLTGTSGAVKTYTILFTDGNTTTFDVTDGEVTNASLAAILEDYAKIDGAYEQMTVGNAEQLISSVTVNDKVPYNFRTSGGSIDIGNREVDKLVGGTVAWNQLLQIPSSSATKTLNGITMTDNRDGSYTLNGTATATTYFAIALNMQNTLTSGHKILICGATSAWVSFVDGWSNRFNCNYRDKIFDYVNSSNSRVDPSFYVPEGTTLNNVKLKPQIIDLTQMFGTTIADYIYSLEQGTAGAGVAWFKKLFPKDYYAYNAGQLMSVKTSAHQMVGFNQLDADDLRQGNYTTPVGANNVCTDGYIRVVPNTTYNWHDTITANGRYVSYYTESKELISQLSKYETGNFTFTTPTDANYIKLLWSKNTGLTLAEVKNGEPTINLHWDGERDGEYEPYVKHSYPLDSDLELRGIPKLDSANNLYYDGDIYESDGTVTRKYGTIDLSAQTWNYQSAWASWYTDYIADMRGTDTGAETPKFICDKYDTIATNYGLTPQDFNGITSTTRGSSGCRILVRNGSTTVAPTGHLVYELATPTTETADPYQNPQIVDDFGTEEYVDERTVAIPVGHDTEYMNNLKAKLEMAPDSPDGDGDYIVRQTNGENSYVPLMKELPSAPSEDGTYTLKCTVASGVATLGWEREE